jgi:uncharacterized protein
MASYALDVTVDAEPVTSAERISSLDTVRGIALCGILLMNITGFGLPFGYSDPTNYGGDTGLNLLAWLTTTLFFEGTMRGMFTMLFGAGVILLTQRLESRSTTIPVADIYYRRNLWLIAFGVVQAYLLLWVGEILYYYGLAALFLYPFRKMRPLFLALLGVLCLASLVPKNLYFLQQSVDGKAAAVQVAELEASGQAVDAELQERADGWAEHLKYKKPDERLIREDIEGMTGGYLGAVAHVTPILTEFQSYDTYVWIFWDVIGFMLIGMALLKWGILSAGQSARFYLIMAVAGYVVALPVNLHEITMIMGSGFDVLAFDRSYLTYDIGRLGMTFGHLGLILYAFKRGFVPGLMARTAAVGRMALTNYIGHTVVCSTLFYAFGLYGGLQRYQLYFVVLAIWAFQLWASPIWMRLFRFGPLEWLWRSLTYWQLQPFRRSGGGMPGAAREA